MIWDRKAETASNLKVEASFLMKFYDG